MEIEWGDCGKYDQTGFGNQLDRLEYLFENWDSVYLDAWRSGNCTENTMENEDLCVITHVSFDVGRMDLKNWVE
jgi:hypothetical protein